VIAASRSTPASNAAAVTDVWLPSIPSVVAVELDHVRESSGDDIARKTRLGAARREGTAHGSTMRAKPGASVWEQPNAASPSDPMCDCPGKRAPTAKGIRRLLLIARNTNRVKLASQKSRTSSSASRRSVWTRSPEARGSCSAPRPHTPPHASRARARAHTRGLNVERSCPNCRWCGVGGVKAAIRRRNPLHSEGRDNRVSGSHLRRGGAVAGGHQPAPQPRAIGRVAESVPLGGSDVSVHVVAVRGADR
jgi:hypothetical protein